MDLDEKWASIGSKSVFMWFARLKKSIAIPITFALVMPLFSSAEIMAAGYTMARSAASPLANPMKVSKGVGNFGFCSAVGGVAFGGVAISEDESEVVRLVYHSKRSDGRRLEALMRDGDNTYNVTLPVYDWEFIPAARFARGEQDAVVTFFGCLSNKEEESRLQKAGCRFMNYHKDVDNTLMGLRLIQADMLAFHSIGPSVFGEGGAAIKGAGEIVPKEGDNRKAINPIQSYYINSGIQSYVICDVGRRIGFRLEGNGLTRTLKLSGDPTWACWKSTITDEDLVGRLTEAYVETLTEAAQQAALSDLPKFQAGFEAFVLREGRHLIMAEKEKSYERLPRESEALSELMKANDGGNPPVYHALTTFMRYAALFRYVKSRDANGYATFVDSLSGVHLKPELETPTVLYPPK